MRTLSRSTMMFGLLALAACGTEPKPQPVAPTPTTTAPAPPPVEAAPDLSPVAAPKNTVAMGRIASVTASIRATEKMVRLPFPLEDLMMRELGDKEFTSLLKLDSPIDGVVVLDPSSPSDKPKVMGAVSLPLRDMKEALAVANRNGKPLTVKPGVYRIGRARDMICDLSVAVGDAPARLVCSEKERDLDLLVPWLTRGMPKETFGTSDVHLELRAEGLRDRYKEEIDRYAPLLPGLATRQLRDAGIQEPALVELAARMSGDVPKLAGDLDAMTLDARLDGDKSEIGLSGSIKFKSANSWVAKLMTHRNDKAGAAPPIFWMAPKDSDSVTYNHGSDPKLFEGAGEGLAAGLRALLTGKLDGADVQALSDLIVKLPLTDAQAVVAARGHLDPPKAAARTVKPADYKPADAVRDTEASVRQLLGWSLVGIEAKSDVYMAWLRDVVKTYNSRTLQAKLKKELGKNAAAHLPTLKTVGAPRGTPAGAMAVELTIPITSRDIWSGHGRAHDHREHPKGAEAKGSITVLLVVAPDGNRTWIGVGSDANALGSHLAAVKEGAPKEGTIASRTGIDVFKGGSFTGGGFLSLGGAVGAALKGSGSVLSESERKDVDMAFAAMPNHGETPILFMTTGTTGASPVNTIEFRVQKGTLDDAMALAMTARTRRPPPEAVPQTAPPPPPPAPKRK